jgi:peptidoglycan/LPS O-acetylase OafA/YrhL
MGIVVADYAPDRVAAKAYEKAATNRLAALDSLRGLAALSVVACHYLILLRGTPIGQSLAPWLRVPPFSLFWSANGAVILFFVLSGYVLALGLLGDRRPGWAGFAARRFCRIWFPYAATLMVSFAIGHAALATDPVLPPVWRMNTWHADEIGFGALTDQIAMMTSGITLDAPGWSLVYELRISLAFPLLLLLVRRAPAITVTACLCLFLAGRHGPPWLGDLVPETATYLIYFAVGAWLAVYRDRTAKLGPRLTTFARALLCAIALVLLSVPSGLPGAGIAAGLGAASVIVLATASPAIGDALSASWCVGLGRISYSLYLTHVVVLMTLGRVLGRFLPIWQVLAVAAPVIGLVAWIGYCWVELPSIRLGRLMAARFG